MSPRNERHVVYDQATGDWKVVGPHAERASARAATQAEAEKRAKQILARDGGGEAVIHRRDGSIRDSDTVSPGNDPHPPTDKKH